MVEVVVVVVVVEMVVGRGLYSFGEVGRGGMIDCEEAVICDVWK